VIHLLKAYIYSVHWLKFTFKYRFTKALRKMRLSKYYYS